MGQTITVELLAVVWSWLDQQL